MEFPLYVRTELHGFGAYLHDRFDRHLGYMGSAQNAATIVAAVNEVAELREQLATLETLRPHWAQGYTSDGIAAQVQTAALASVWEALKVDNQSDCMQRLRSLVLP